MQSNDVVIIGAGIVGLATAYNLSLEYPKKTILVIEKERINFDAPQTGPGESDGGTDGR